MTLYLRDKIYSEVVPSTIRRDTLLRYFIFRIEGDPSSELTKTRNGNEFDGIVLNTMRSVTNRLINNNADQYCIY